MEMNTSGMPTQTNTTSWSKAAGILLIISGVISILTGIVFVMIATILPGIFSSMSSSMSQDQFPHNYSNYSAMIQNMSGIYVVCGIIIIVFAIFAILGGIMALQRKMWALALVGAILGLLSFGFFISSILSIIAIVLLAISKSDFDKTSTLP